MHGSNIYYSNCTSDTCARTHIPVASEGTNEDRVVLSFYELKEIPHEKLNGMKKLLKSRLEALGVFGRIYLAPEGLNAQISLPKNLVAELKKTINETLSFKNLYFNESTGKI